MLSGEDFGYLKDEERNKMGIVTKRALLIGAVLFSISCFVYITINAYYFAYHDQNNNIKIVKSPDFDIKVVEEQDNSNVSGIDKSVYDSIIGNKNLIKENLNSVKLVEPARMPVVSRNNQDYLSTKDVAKNIQNKPPQNINSSGIVVFDANKDQTKDHAKNDVSVIDFSNKNKPYNSETTNDNANKKPEKGLSRVQVAALSSRNSAIDYWTRLKNKSPRLFSGYNYFIQEVNLGARGTFYRLQIGNFRNQVEAEKFCTQFISQTGKSRADCIIVE